MAKEPTDAEINIGMWTDLCTLLDRIEVVVNEPEKVYALCQERFNIARRNGLEVRYLGPVTAGDQ